MSAIAVFILLLAAFIFSIAPINIFSVHVKRDVPRSVAFFSSAV